MHLSLFLLQMIKCERSSRPTLFVYRTSFPAIYSHDHVHHIVISRVNHLDVHVCMSISVWVWSSPLNHIILLYRSEFKPMACTSAVVNVVMYRSVTLVPMAFTMSSSEGTTCMDENTAIYLHNENAHTTNNNILILYSPMIPYMVLRSIRIYVGVLDINTLYRVFCFFKLVVSYGRERVKKQRCHRKWTTYTPRPNRNPLASTSTSHVSSPDGRYT